MLGIILGCTHSSQFEPCPSAFDHQSAVRLISVSAPNRV